MYISKVSLKNIRCFDEMEIKFSKNSKPILWTTLLGDNSTGKTTFLRSIAIGLCDESSAAGLLRESEEGYIRNGSKGNGIIEITLSDYDGKELGKITTSIEKILSTEDKFLFEKLSQTLTPSDFNPWGEIFICGYGVGRGVSGTGDITGYSPISAVYNLFNYSEGLQNPELVIRRIKDEKKDNKRYKEIKKVLKKVLNLPIGSKIKLEQDGIKVAGGTWKKKMPLRDLADGYQSTFQWVTDFLGWYLSFRNDEYKSDSFKGIVLVDGLEEHLHPKWQRTLLKTLHEDVFNNIQFIVATHSPLIASSTVDYDDTSLIEFEQNEKGSVKKNPIKNKDLRGLRADEVLRHDAFGLSATTSIKSMDDFKQYAELISTKDLSEEQQKELKHLEETVKNKYVFGETQFERDVEKAVLSTLTEMIGNPTNEHIIATKKQLGEIFK